MRDMIKISLDLLHAIGIKNENILLCGSLALHYQGLCPREPKDVDICIRNASELQENLIKTITDAQGNNYYKSNEYNIPEVEKKPYIFKYGEVEMNIWFVKEFNTPLKSEEGFYIQRADTVLQAKMSYGRDKDYEDISKIIADLVNPNWGKLPF